MNTTHEIMVRGYKRGVLVWENKLVMCELDLDRLIPTLVDEHIAEIQKGTVGMIEMEFLDVPESEDRFFRIGVEPDGMVLPIHFKIQELCHCGQPLHYADPAARRAVEKLIELQGECVPITAGERTWLVPRHYIALHGIKAEELPTLGFREITEQ
jgi:hypothetical protein